MPVLAVIGAVAAIGIAAETGFAVFATIAAVGATIGAVGAVTNNKALMIAGGVIGAIGGIGALAQSAGILGSDVGLFGGSFGDGFGSGGSVFGGEAFGPPANLSPQAAVDSWNGVGPEPFGPPEPYGPPGLGGGGQIVDQTGAMQPLEASTSPALASANAPDVTPAGAVDGGVPPPQGDAGQFNAPYDATRASLQPGNPDATTNAILNRGTGAEPFGPPASAAPNAPAVPAAGDVTGTPASLDIPAPSTINQKAGGVDPSAWTSIKEFLKNNDRLAAGVIQAGGSFISGATNGLTPAQIAALNAQAEVNQAAANLSRTQQANMAQPLPVASRAPPVTGAPIGLINTPPRVNVTGAA